MEQYSQQYQEKVELVEKYVMFVRGLVKSVGFGWRLEEEVDRSTVKLQIAECPEKPGLVKNVVIERIF